MSDTYLTFPELNGNNLLPCGDTKGGYCRFSSRNGKSLSAICNLLIEMPQLKDVAGAKSSCHDTDRSIYGRLWTYGERLNKFMDPKMHFQS
jgi:hypothetical protein